MLSHISVTYLLFVVPFLIKMKTVDERELTRSVKYGNVLYSTLPLIQAGSRFQYNVKCGKSKTYY